MKEPISRKEFGERINRLRKKRGFTQQDLAKLIGISRPSLAQIELGNRGIEISELQKFAFTLHFTFDEIFSENFTAEKNYAQAEILEPSLVEERVSIPYLKTKKFQQVLLYILEQCAGKPNVGETVLYKLLYFSDFNYYELYETHLTGAIYRKLPFGPVPQNLENILDEMIHSGQLQKVKTPYYDYFQTRYLPLIKPDLTLLRASEKEVIDNVVGQMSNWSASAISDYSHKDMPWLASKDGEVIDYELVFYREIPFSVRKYQEET